MKHVRRKPEAVPDSVSAELARFFDRNGYVRWQDPRRQRREGHQRYKKGDEVRLVATSRRELSRIRRLLRQAGFKPSQPFVKGRQYRQPVYGRDAVERFVRLIARHEVAE